MSEVLHGTATWPGVLANISCQYTCAHGVSPGVATFVMAAQPEFEPPNFGDLTITDGPRSVTLVGCKVDKLESDKANTVWQLYILDRRWKWAFKQISGQYNVRDDHNELIKETKKSAFELAVLCLREMGEAQTAAIDGLPTDQFPPVDWVADNPAAELESIAGQYGSRVVYQPVADRVLVALLGVGADLPDGPTAKDSPTIDFPETPDSMLLVGAPSEYETYIALEAVMMDMDGQVKPNDEILYKPTAGSSYTCPGNPNTLKQFKPNIQFEELTEQELNDKIKGLFLESYLKWYRIVMRDVGDVTSNPLGVPGYGRVTDRRQVIISDRRVKTTANWDGTLVALPAEVRGKFWRAKQLKAAAQDAFMTSLPSEKTDTPFSVDAAQGLVKFQDPMQIIRSGLTYPAQLVLRCAVQVRQPGSGDLARYAREWNLGGSAGTGPEVVKRPEVAYKTIGNYELVPRLPELIAPQWRLKNYDDNLKAADALADAFLLQAARRYESKEAQQREYPGTIPIDPDGAIQQVTYSVSSSAPPSTQASRNSEHAFWLATYEELRRVRFVREAARPLDSDKDFPGLTRRFRTPRIT